VDAIQDFEDFLDLLERHGVRYLIIGGLAFIYHAKPRFTKDIDIWLDPEPDNLARANAALAESRSVVPTPPCRRSASLRPRPPRPASRPCSARASRGPTWARRRPS